MRDIKTVAAQSFFSGKGQQQCILLIIDPSNQTHPPCSLYNDSEPFENYFVISGVSLEAEAPLPAVEKASSQTIEELEQSATASPCDASTAKAMADIARFLGGGSDPTSTIRDVIAATERLSSVLEITSDRAAIRDVQDGGKSTTSDLSIASSRNVGRSSMWLDYASEAMRLKDLHEGTGVGGDKHEFLIHTAEIFVCFSFSDWTYQGPIFRFHLRPEPRLWYQPCGRVVIFKHNPETSIGSVFASLMAQHACERMIGIPTQWFPSDAVGIPAPHLNLPHAIRCERDGY